MPAYDFSLIISGKNEFTDADVNALFEAGCDDGTPGSNSGVASIDFTRDGDSLLWSIRSAIADVEKAGFKVTRVEIATSALAE
ncbi:hypothetical protein [Singulisphaera acidiphila]|uniref:Uncharacterized protein n=1 Tax=Singulisphaera acidiphila (strain ATCC BAA-1392 / DSM 18658 / VKM B-2454 / MOB10) TaxID=886293 RepID=L0DH98_SINAD|nr:hypothetical protein [Singulisphaera acidiphila]AGA28632.1 hypothetical protein Sinac_4443 [Singulisphaera acidiphila DSM 18658]